MEIHRNIYIEIHSINTFKYIHIRICIAYIHVHFWNITSYMWVLQWLIDCWGLPQEALAMNILLVGMYTDQSSFPASKIDHGFDTANFAVFTFKHFFYSPSSCLSNPQDMIYTW